MVLTYDLVLNPGLVDLGLHLMNPELDLVNPGLDLVNLGPSLVSLQIIINLQLQSRQCLIGRKHQVMVHQNQTIISIQKISLPRWTDGG